MAHEIEANDRIVLANQAAWHGLGTILQGDITIDEAVRVANLGWQVEQWPLSATNGEAGDKRKSQAVPTHVLNVRGDDLTPLGVVGSGYRPLQNVELGRFAEALVDESKGDRVFVESAGSLRGGRRVWFLLRGESFAAGNNPDDPIGTYLLLANGHDGGLQVWITPTSTRVVCSNTFHIALGSAKGTKTIRFRHEGDLTNKVEDARNTLGLYHDSVSNFRKQVDALAKREMTKAEIDKFILEAWELTEFKIPKNPTTQKEKDDREKAMEAYTQQCNNFDADRKKIGAKKATAWSAFNAVTQWQQHQRVVRAKNDIVRKENRVFNDIFGNIANKKAQAFDLALSLL